MTFQIKQNGEFITLNSFDEQFCAFTKRKVDTSFFGQWFSLLEAIFNTWGGIVDYSSSDNYVVRKLKMDTSREISAKKAAHCAMLWATLNNSEADEIVNTLKWMQPTVDFFNSLEDTTFYFSF